MPMLQITIMPSPPKEGTGVSEYVAEALEIVKKSGLKYELSPTATIIEGGLDELFKIAKEIHEVSFKKGARRVVTVLMIDDRRDKEITMEYKKKSVLSKVKG